MPYTPDLDWVNDAPPGLTAARMIKLQLGVQAAVAGAESALAGVGTAQTAAAQAAAAAAVVTDGGLIFGKSGQKYQLLTCVIRNAGGTEWSLIDNPGHIPTGVESVETLSDRINLHYDFYGLPGSLQVTCDETLSSMGIRAGASVGSTFASIKLFADVGGLGDYVYYDTGTSSWVSQAGVFSGFSFNTANGRLTMNHAEVLGSQIGSATSRHPGNRVALSAAGTTQTSVDFLQVGSSSHISAPSATTAVWIWRGGRTVQQPLNPATINPTLGNIWITGMFEVSDEVPD